MPNREKLAPKRNPENPYKKAEKKTQKKGTRLIIFNSKSPTKLSTSLSTLAYSTLKSQVNQKLEVINKLLQHHDFVLHLRPLIFTHYGLETAYPDLELLLLVRRAKLIRWPYLIIGLKNLFHLSNQSKYNLHHIRKQGQFAA
jgi:hypothetical protein